MLIGHQLFSIELACQQNNQPFKCFASFLPPFMSVSMWVNFRRQLLKRRMLEKEKPQIPRVATSESRTCSTSSSFFSLDSSTLAARKSTEGKTSTYSCQTFLLFPKTKHNLQKCSCQQRSMFPTSHQLYIFFLSFTSSKCHNIAFTCQSREIRERGLTDMLDKRSIASTERLNRLASPPSGTADAPGINQAAASPQPGVGRLANNAVVMLKGKCECGRGGEAHRKQQAVLVRLGNCVVFRQQSAALEMFRPRPSHCESTAIQLTVLLLIQVLAFSTTEGEVCCSATETTSDNLPRKKKPKTYLCSLR